MTSLTKSKKTQLTFLYGSFGHFGALLLVSRLSSYVYFYTFHSATGKKKDWKRREGYFRDCGLQLEQEQILKDCLSQKSRFHFYFDHLLIILQKIQKLAAVFTKKKVGCRI